MSLEEQMRAAADRLTLAQCKRLATLGVTCWPDLTARGLIGVARVSISGDLFDYDEAGKVHIVLPVSDDGELVDLVAFDPINPDDWALKTGNGTALGESRIIDALDKQGWPDAKALELFPTPLEWLRADCRGACIVDGFKPATASRLRRLTHIVCSTDKFMRALRLQLSRPPRIPEMSVLEAKRNAA